jgi:hypothetical protein
MRSKRLADAFDRLEAQERVFLEREFLAPALRGHPVGVRMAGVVLRLQIKSADFEGFGVFRPMSFDAAELVRTATPGEIRRYVQLFPRVRLILCRREQNFWLAVPAHLGDHRFRIEGLVPVRFVEEAEQFEVVQARFDGSNFWFEAVDPAGNASRAAYLRQSLLAGVDANHLECAGLTPEEIGAYAINCIRDEAMRRQTEAERAQERLREALEHAGAGLVDFLERPDGFRVTFAVGDQRYISAVRKNDLTVEVAGICLSGRDSDFDLASLVGVIREAGETGELVAIGRDNFGMAEEQYWHVHPREQ